MKTYKQILLSILTGILVFLSFPVTFSGITLPNLGFLAWFALVPLFYAIQNADHRRTFLLSFIAALVWYSGSLYWIYIAVHNYGHLGAVTSFFVTLLLIVIFSFYISLAPMLSKRISSYLRTETIILLPVIWVAIEFSRNYFPFNGFPWANIAMSQYEYLPIIQVVDLTGIYGLIFIIIMANVFIAEFLNYLGGNRVNTIIGKAVVLFILLSALIGYGFYRYKTFVPDQKTTALKIAVIQGNIPQEDKWDDLKAKQNLDAYIGSVKKLNSLELDLIIWPEASYPWIMPIQIPSISKIALGLDKRKKQGLPYTILGAVSTNAADNMYNSAFLFNAKGEKKGVYHKAHLVPFGEYVPLKKLLFFAKKLTHNVGNLIAGNNYEPLTFQNQKPGILICYEDIFPEISRKTVKNGANFLVNLTNDAWYGFSSAPFQHLALSVFRAIENKRYLIRSTNTGVSAIIDPLGRVVMKSGIFEPSLLISAILPISQITTYTSLGDWFAFGCSGYLLICMLLVIRIKFFGGRRCQKK